MVASEKEFKGVKIGLYEESKDLEVALKKHVNGNVFVLCVGTDRLTGDSFAPFVGTFLKQKGYENVLGTIDDPVHAVNLDEKIKEIPEGYTVLAIDASLGENVGKLTLHSGSLLPGRGVGKELTPVGDFNIGGIVNKAHPSSDMLNLMGISNTRLSVVIKLAETCAEAINEAFPMSINKHDYIRNVN